MSTDLHGIQNLVDRFLDAYGEDLVKQLRDIKYYAANGAAVDRLLAEKEEIFLKVSALRTAAILKPAQPHTKDQYKDFIFQAESLSKRKITPHIEEYRKLISEVQVKSAYRTRMSWEGVKSRLSHLGQLAEELHGAVRDYIRATFLPDLERDFHAPGPSLGIRPIATPAPRLTFEAMASGETFTDDESLPYDHALKSWETFLAKERGGEVSKFTERLKVATTPLAELGRTLFPTASGYENILKPGYVSLEECRSMAEPLETLGSRIKALLPQWVSEIPKPLYYEGTDAEGQPQRRRVILGRLFRNLELHIMILKSIRRDVYYDVGYYLYYRPVFDHFLELRLILDKHILARVPLRDRYHADLKFAGHLINDLKSRLEQFHSELRRHF